MLSYCVFSSGTPQLPVPFDRSENRVCFGVTRPVQLSVVPGRRSFQSCVSTSCGYIDQSSSIIIFVFYLFIFKP